MEREVVTPGLSVSWSDLDMVRTSAAECMRCALAQSRSRVVFGEGNPHATLLIVGEAPGADEDSTGRPFVGRAGKTLDRTLRSVGLSKAEAFVTNAVLCRPPGNRTPTATEASACSPYLAAQVDLVRPRVIVTMGVTALRRFLRSPATVRDARGRAHASRGALVVPTYHPSSVNRGPGRLREMAADFALARSLMRTSE